MKHPWIDVLADAAEGLELLGCQIVSMYASTHSVPKILIVDGAPLMLWLRQFSIEGLQQEGQATYRGCVVMWAKLN